MRETIIGLLVLVSTFVVSLGVAELLLRHLSPSREVGPSFTIFDEIYGKRLRPNARVVRWTPEYEMTLTTNTLGFRGAEVPVHADVILFLGDSFTMGYGVDDGQEFPALVRTALQARGQKIEVVNAGIGDSGNGRWVRFLRRDAPAFNVRAVVLQIHDNDFGDNLREQAFRIGHDDELIERPVHGPSTARRVQDWMEWIAPFAANLHLVSRVRQLLAYQAGSRAPASTAGSQGPALGVALTLRLIEESIAICRERKWPVFVLLVDLRSEYQLAVEQMLRREEVPFRTLAWRLERPELYYRVDGHWNAAGQEVAAGLVLELLETVDLREGHVPEGARP